MEETFFGVFRKNKFIYTVSLNPGKTVYGERIIKEGKEYRSWDPHRSKLSAAILNGLKEWPFKKDSQILYLGASTGTTVSHLSDICVNGEIFSVEISAHVMNKLVALSEKRENIIPILADAKKTSEYEDVGQVEILYQDVSQPDQDEILILNSQKFLKKGGIAFFAVKSQSIDVLKDPKKVFEEVEEKLKKEFKILERIKLEPFDKDHIFLVLEKL